VTTSDPFEVLGLERGATLAEARLARRRLAFEAHPDRGGSGDEMRLLNAAFEAVVAHLTGRRPLPKVAAERDNATEQEHEQEPTVVRPTRRAARSRFTGRAQHDAASFVIAALPAEAFEALVVVTSWIGEVLVDAPPYVLEVHLYEPVECWCRLDLVPDAGASTVSLTVASDGVAPAPLLDDVRDVWVQQLNQPGAFE
jgi:hypothetical protein